MADEDLTPQEKQLLVAWFLSLLQRPQVRTSQPRATTSRLSTLTFAQLDFDMFTRLGSFSNVASANTAWWRLSKKGVEMGNPYLDPPKVRRKGQSNDGGGNIGVSAAEPGDAAGSHLPLAPPPPQPSPPTLPPLPPQWAVEGETPAAAIETTRTTLTVEATSSVEPTETSDESDTSTAPRNYHLGSPLPPPPRYTGPGYDQDGIPLRFLFPNPDEPGPVPEEELFRRRQVRAARFRAQRSMRESSRGRSRSKGIGKRQGKK